MALKKELFTILGIKKHIDASKNIFKIWFRSVKLQNYNKEF